MPAACVWPCLGVEKLHGWSGWHRGLSRGAVCGRVPRGTACVELRRGAARRAKMPRGVWGIEEGCRAAGLGAARRLGLAGTKSCRAALGTGQVPRDAGLGDTRRSWYWKFGVYHIETSNEVVISASGCRAASCNMVSRDALGQTCLV